MGKEQYFEGCHPQRLATQFNLGSCARTALHPIVNRFSSFVPDAANEVRGPAGSPSAGDLGSTCMETHSKPQGTQLLTASQLEHRTVARVAVLIITQAMPSASV